MDFIITNLQNLYISTAAGMVMNKYNETPIDQDYVEKLLFVKKNREFYRDQEDADKDAQDQVNKESNELNKQKEKVKAIKEIKTLLSYLHLRLVTDEEELDVIIDQYKMEKQLLLKFLKQQLHGFKNCYINLQVSVTMSNKNDKHIGTLLELTNRLKAVLTNIRNNNMQRITHLPESITTTKFDHIANFGTQSEVYIAAKELAVSDTKQLID